MVIGDETAEDNDGHPDQKCQNREPLDRYTMDEFILPMLFVFPENELENGGNQRSDGDEEHLEPEGHSDQLADRLTNNHQHSSGEKYAERAGQPGPESIRC